jgi:predicted enzyme related to lactoylglutathione lyase
MSTTIRTGRFVWFEHGSKDPKRAQAFFAELFHWKPREQSDEVRIALGDRTLGGYVQGSEPARWLSYLQVTDAAAAAAKVTASGGNIGGEPRVSDDGTSVRVFDPLGAELALWQPKSPSHDEYLDRDGAFIWNELYSMDPDRSIAFYRELGGFETERLKSNRNDRYDVLKSDGKGRGGVMKMDGVPPMWMPYVKVAKCDDAVALAKQLGGTFHKPAEDVAGAGRIAILHDPLGAMLGLLEPHPM